LCSQKETFNDEHLFNIAFNFNVRLYSAAPQTAVGFNQMTRWVMTKEEHCSKIISKVGPWMSLPRIDAYSCFSNLKAGDCDKIRGKKNISVRRFDDLKLNGLYPVLKVPGSSARHQDLIHWSPNLL